MIRKTRIAITKETRNRLAEIGTKDQNFEEIIRELIKKWNEGR